MIDADSVLGLAHAIDLASTMDLLAFITSDSLSGFSEEDWAQRLSGPGLMKPLPSGAIGAPKNYYAASDLGKRLRQVLEYAGQI